jgi:hypothetical protein
MKQHTFLFVSAFILIHLAGCKKNETSSAPNLHLDYFSLVEGRYAIYEAQEIYHDDDSGIHDTVNFLLKTVIGDIYQDNLGRSGREFGRYKSFDSGATWQLSDTWVAFSDNLRAELVEENQRIVKLVFAPTESKEWDINAYNSMPEQIAIYENIHESFAINGISFDSTVTVVQADFFSLVDYQKQREVYSKNAGLVEKYYKNLVIENFDTLHPKKGNEIFYRLTDFGIE